MNRPRRSAFFLLIPGWGQNFIQRIIMNFLFFIGLALSLAFLPSKTWAEERELPLFPENHTAEGEDPFKTALEAYQAGHFARAVSEADQLLLRLSTGPLSETASFLRGDLHLKWAEKEGPSHLHDALAAFKEAQLKYPDSENAIRALWRTGQIYEKLGLYYESIGSFKRILLRHPNSRFNLPARIGIAKTYEGWKKWKEAADAYEQIDLRSLSDEDRLSVLLGHADSLYHQNDFEAAYQKYERGRSLSPSPATPAVLFQHAVSAYRSGRMERAREIFYNLLTLAPTDPLAPVALAKTGDTWRKEGKFDKAGLIYAQVQSSSTPNPSGGLDKLVASIGQLAMQECGAPPPRGHSSPCLAIRDREEIRESLERMEKQATTLLQSSLQSPRLDDFAQETLFEAIEQFRIYGSLPVALDLESRLLDRVPSSYFRLRLVALHRKTIVEEISRLAQEEDDLKIVALFHARSSDFTPPMLTGPTGLQVGISHARLGLHAQAIELFAPITVAPSSHLAEEALFFLGKSLLEKGDYPQAEQKWSAFLKRYPKSRRISSLLVDLGTVFSHQGKHNRAIEVYGDWLRTHPKDPGQERVSLLLAKAYRKKGDFRKEVAVYLKEINRNPENAADLSIPLGDAYYRLREYPKAIQAYQTALKEKPEAPEGDWIQLQIAKSYRALGQKSRGQALFDQLAQNAKDPLVRQLAVEAMATLNLRSIADGNRRKEG